MTRCFIGEDLWSWNVAALTCGKHKAINEHIYAPPHRTLSWINIKHRCSNANMRQNGNNYGPYHYISDKACWYMAAEWSLFGARALAVDPTLSLFPVFNLSECCGRCGWHLDKLKRQELAGCCLHCTQTSANTLLQKDASGALKSAWQAAETHTHTHPHIYVFVGTDMIKYPSPSSS